MAADIAEKQEHYAHSHRDAQKDQERIHKPCRPGYVIFIGYVPDAVCESYSRDQRNKGSNHYISQTLAETYAVEGDAEQGREGTAQYVHKNF